MHPVLLLDVYPSKLCDYPCTQIFAHYNWLRALMLVIVLSRCFDIRDSSFIDISLRFYDGKGDNLLVNDRRSFVYNRSITKILKI